MNRRINVHQAAPDGANGLMGHRSQHREAWTRAWRDRAGEASRVAYPTLSIGVIKVTSLRAVTPVEERKPTAA